MNEPTKAAAASYARTYYKEAMKVLEKSCPTISEALDLWEHQTSGWPPPMWVTVCSLAISAALILGVVVPWIICRLGWITP